jgi:hypothetical protein
LPFQLSASESLPADPTAVHAVAAVQETPLRALALLLGFGVVCIDQPVPFQRSANVVLEGVFALIAPTAVQALGDEHDTAENSALWASWGFGGLRSDQVVPFQVSTSSSCCTRLSIGPVTQNAPTAVQLVGDVHDTPSSSLAIDLAGTGTGTILQLLPSHDSARAPPLGLS